MSTLSFGIGGEKEADGRRCYDSCSETEEAAEDVEYRWCGGEGCEEGAQAKEGEAEYDLDFSAEEVGCFAEERHEGAVGESVGLLTTLIGVT